MKRISYRSSGVNISRGEEFVEVIKPLVRSTFTKGVISGIGNFGAFFKPDLNKFKDPVFVSSIDGVGTKIKIAAQLGKFDTIGEDLVNHCVNDIAVCGAEPLFFLDYYATGKLNVPEAADIVKGLVRGCKRNNCSLIGGETAEMPGLYAVGDFDLAGAIIGIVDKKKIIDKKNVRKGDILIGLGSSGLHTNGYSLVRKIFDTKKKLNTYNVYLNYTIGEALLKVHRSYLKIIKEVTSKYIVHSISHITGGGIEGNTVRVIPENLKLEIDWKSWRKPLIFDIIRKKGNVTETEMRRAFNLGIGLIFIVPEKEAGKIQNYLKRKKERSYIIGRIV